MKFYKLCKNEDCETAFQAIYDAFTTYADIRTYYDTIIYKE